LQGIAEPNSVVIAESTRKLLGNRPTPEEDFEFFLSPDKLSQSASVQSLEATFDPARA
jgi:hypothetical protein